MCRFFYRKEPLPDVLRIYSCSAQGSQLLGFKGLVVLGVGSRPVMFQASNLPFALYFHTHTHICEDSEYSALIL